MLIYQPPKLSLPLLHLTHQNLLHPPIELVASFLTTSKLHPIEILLQRCLLIYPLVRYKRPHQPQAFAPHTKTSILDLQPCRRWPNPSKAKTAKSQRQKNLFTGNCPTYHKKISSLSDPHSVLTGQGIRGALHEALPMMTGMMPKVTVPSAPTITQRPARPQAQETFPTRAINMSTARRQQKTTSHTLNGSVDPRERETLLTIATTLAPLTTTIHTTVTHTCTRTKVHRPLPATHHHARVGDQVPRWECLPRVLQKQCRRLNPKSHLTRIAKTIYLRLNQVQEDINAR
jgi:hypothetical protein